MKKNISILREKKIGEKRVILLPSAIPLFLEKGFKVFVEKGAGNGIGVDDADYEKTGAKLVSTETAWSESSILIKYKPPAGDDFLFLDSTKHIGAVFHAEGDPELTGRLVQSGCCAYTYEFFRTPEGIFPASVASSEIAGKVAILYAAWHLLIGILGQSRQNYNAVVRQFTELEHGSLIEYQTCTTVGEERKKIRQQDFNVSEKALIKK